MDTETQAETIAAFIERVGLTMTAEPAPDNPNADADTWSEGASHWLCTIKPARGRPMAVPYSQGSAYRRWKLKLPAFVGDWTDHDAKRFGAVPGERVGHLFLSQTSQWAERIRAELTEATPPDLASVLDCLASDASSYDNARDFDDWAGEYGYDTDSRKAERTYRIVGEQAKRLRHLLGATDYANLISNVERL